MRVMRCRECGKPLNEDEVLWATEEGDLNSDVGHPWCDECIPLPRCDLCGGSKFVHHVDHHNEVVTEPCPHLYEERKKKSDWLVTLGIILVIVLFFVIPSC